jgi:hypothetical protein
VLEARAELLRDEATRGKPTQPVSLQRSAGPQLTGCKIRGAKPRWVMCRQNCPSAFLCPITGEILRDPVLASDGFSYEVSSAIHHLACRA